MSVLMVTGSREKYWRDKTLVKCAITNRLSTYPLDTVVVQGGADGVDCWTKIACEIVGLECRTFYPRTDLPSPHRFHERNDRMLGLADEVLAFWDGKSPGTASVIKKARHSGVVIWVVELRGAA